MTARKIRCCPSNNSMRDCCESVSSHAAPMMSSFDERSVMFICLVAIGSGQEAAPLTIYYAIPVPVRVIVALLNIGISNVSGYELG